MHKNIPEKREKVINPEAMIAKLRSNINYSRAGHIVRAIDARLKPRCGDIAYAHAPPDAKDTLIFPSKYMEEAIRICTEAEKWYEAATLANGCDTKFRPQVSNFYHLAIRKSMLGNHYKRIAEILRRAGKFEQADEFETDIKRSKMTDWPNAKKQFLTYAKDTALKAITEEDCDFDRRVYLATSSLFCL